VIEERIVHHLSAAVRFLDHFTGAPVRAPLAVRADRLPAAARLPPVPWTAHRARVDATYRFQVANETVPPAGAIAVTIEAPSREYAAFEPLTLNLPLVPPPHPPPVQPGDFLVEHPLWPTRAFRIPAGETAVVGTVRSGGANPIDRLRLRLWTGGGLPPAAPYAYTDALGEFVFRLPRLVTAAGPPVVTTAQLDVEIRLPPAYAVAAPVAAAAPFAIPLSVTLGRVTTVTLTIP
jgi:hypothetical protein